jgi:hypothetical protein
MKFYTSDKNENDNHLQSRLQNTLPDRDFEYIKNIKILAEQRQTMLNTLKRIAIATGIGLTLVFGYKYLKAEDIMKSSTQQTQVGAVSNSTVSLNPQIATIPKPEQNCNLSEDENYYKRPVNKMEVLSCLNDIDASNVISALLFISKGKNKNIFGTKEFEDVVVKLLYRDPFLHPYVFRAIANQNYNSAVPVLVKDFDKIGSSAIEEAVYVLLHFSLKGDWNAINKLISLSSNENETVRIHAMSALLFIDKNIMPFFIEQYNKENSETRFEIIKHADILYFFYIKDYFREDEVSKIRELLNKRLSNLLRFEKDEKVREIIQSIHGVVF